MKKLQDTVELLRGFLNRQEQSIVGHVLSWVPYPEVMNPQRWRRELSDDLIKSGLSICETDKLVNQICSEIESQVQFAQKHYGLKEERHAALMATYADIGNRLAGIVNESLQIRIVEPSGKQVLYKLYDVGDRVLYIGITDRGPARLVEHYRNKPWFGSVVRVEFERYETRQEVVMAEEKAIKQLRPVYNIVHNRNGVAG